MSSELFKLKWQVFTHNNGVILNRYLYVILVSAWNKKMRYVKKHLRYDTSTAPEQNDSVLTWIHSQQILESKTATAVYHYDCPGDAVLISQHWRCAHSYFSSKMKLGGRWSERQRARWGWAMAALLSDVKISSLTPSGGCWNMMS